ncbi:unnamed protein product [Porites lobata]|uniref:DNA-directed DNA polymerase n=1 Tax=Porites lobata TaxID=104759 RepID=A0ABN8NFA7_9CNID|nr:unnamed protein product [Porites lobata]
MSNQSTDGFQGSQPFITDKQFQNSSLDEIRHIIAEEKEELKKDYKELGKRRKLIKQYKKLKEAREKVKQGIDIKKEIKKPKPSAKTVVPFKKMKTFDEYFEECIKNRKIPKDTPSYFREALGRAILEYDQGLEKEKSAFEDFAVKYTIQGIPGLTPIQFFERIYKTLKDFFTYHRNIKFKMILVCIREKQTIQQNVGVVGLEEGKSYFTSGTYNNIKSTDVDKLIKICIDGIEGGIENYQETGSAWYFKEVEKLEIHTVEYNPTKGSSYIPLPDWISNKKAIVNIENKVEKCFIWCILRYLHPRKDNDSRLADLKKYEFSLNTKGITFPMKLKDITKFEKLNPSIPGINVFSVNEMVDKKFKPIIYSKTKEDEDISKVFVEKLTEVTKGIYNDFYRRPKPLRLTRAEQKSFDEAEICHVCKKELKKDKARDHCHFTGQYRGAAHNSCNLQCRKPMILPVIFHNLQGYDAHLFIKQLARLPVYPYDYVSSLEKLYETQLPPKEEFYSKLSDGEISDDDY